MFTCTILYIIGITFRREKLAVAIENDNYIKGRPFANKTNNLALFVFPDPNLCKVYLEPFLGIQLILIWPDIRLI
jgi:hypothetical protein